MSVPAGDSPPPPTGDAPTPLAPTPLAPTALESALTAERERSQGLERELAASRQRDEVARIAGMDEGARKIEEAKSAVRAELEAEHKGELLKYRVRAGAAAFHDADLAAGLITLPIDATDEQITAALTQLGTEKPYLLRSGTAPAPIPQGPSGGGNGGEPSVGDGETYLRQLYRNRQSGQHLQL